MEGISSSATTRTHVKQCSKWNRKHRTQRGTMGVDSRRLQIMLKINKITAALGLLGGPRSHESQERLK
jgi:hypothetical protein